MEQPAGGICRGQGDRTIVAWTTGAGLERFSDQNTVRLNPPGMLNEVLSDEVRSRPGVVVAEVGRSEWVLERLGESS